MSNLRNTHVALSISRVKGHYIRQVYRCQRRYPLQRKPLIHTTCYRIGGEGIGLTMEYHAHRPAIAKKGYNISFSMKPFCTNSYEEDLHTIRITHHNKLGSVSGSFHRVYRRKLSKWNIFEPGKKDL